MRKSWYYVYVGGLWFFKRNSSSAAKAVEETADQIENLDPLNSSAEGREAYRNRFRNKKIEAFKVGSPANPYT